MTISAVGMSVTPAWAQQSTEELAAAAQNPVAAMISLPFQNNTFFNAGPNHDKTANVLNIQLVLPFTVGDWNIISRTIAPLIALPSLTAPDLGDVITSGPSSNDPFGLGDINQTFYSSPAAPSEFIWGVGPSVTLPTATQRVLGPRTLSMGPGAVGLVTPKPWVIGTLARQLWAVAGPTNRSTRPSSSPLLTTICPTGGMPSVRRSSRRIGARRPGSDGAFRSAAALAKSLRSATNR
jgi:hypothetical protein